MKSLTLEPDVLNSFSSHCRRSFACRLSVEADLEEDTMFSTTPLLLMSEGTEGLLV